MPKSLCILTLVIAQLLAGSGGAVHLCLDCGALLSEAAADPHDHVAAPHCCCCCIARPVTNDLTLTATHHHEPPLLLLQRQAPSRLRDGDSTDASQHARALPAALPLLAADLLRAQGLSRPSDSLSFGPGSAHLSARATVCLRC